MRNLNLLEKYRMHGPEVIRHYGWAGDDTCGVFEVPSPIDRAPMCVIASAECGWEHVSVSRRNRCPNWIEMSAVKDLFFGEGETVMQLHVPSTDHVNDHPNCLHLWRPTRGEIPRPPQWMVGGVSKQEAERAAREWTP